MLWPSLVSGPLGQPLLQKSSILHDASKALAKELSMEESGASATYELSIFTVCRPDSSEDGHVFTLFLNTETIPFHPCCLTQCLAKTCLTNILDHVLNLPNAVPFNTL